MAHKFAEVKLVFTLLRTCQPFGFGVRSCFLLGILSYEPATIVSEAKDRVKV